MKCLHICDLPHNYSNHLTLKRTYQIRNWLCICYKCKFIFHMCCKCDSIDLQTREHVHHSMQISLSLEFLSGADLFACRTALRSNRLLIVYVYLVCFLFNALMVKIVLWSLFILYSIVHKRCVSQAFRDQHNVRLTYFFVWFAGF